MDSLVRVRSMAVRPASNADAFRPSGDGHAQQSLGWPGAAGAFGGGFLLGE
jgi:hypothetical protein